MLNGDGNENGNKISRFNKPKKNFHVQCTFLGISLVLFCTTDISQFQLCLAPLPPFPGYCGAVAHVVSPGAGALPGGQAFANRAFGTLAVFYQNITEDFTGKTSRLAHLSRTGNCKGMFSILCMQLILHCLLSQNYMAK